MEEYLTIPEVAADPRVRASRQTVWGWVKSGELPALKVGRHYRVARADLEKFIRPVGREGPTAAALPFEMA